MSPADLALLMKKPLFAALGADKAARLLKGSFVQTVPKGAVLFEQGARADFAHIVLSGAVGLYAAAEATRDTIVEIFGEGEVFVAPAVILDMPLLVSARATVESRVLVIPAEIFRRALEAEHEFALVILRGLARHWRLLVRQIKALKLKTGGQRLASYLAGLAGEGAGAATIDLPAQKTVIAARLGLTPETLSRAFHELRAAGVEAQGKRIAVADRARLRAVAGFADQE
jgi:CRP/FNR family transcriptional regulator, transcriptional activator FtrB